MAEQSSNLSRRQFAALSLAVGTGAAYAAAASRPAAAADDVIDTDVSISTPNGVCDAALIHPKGKGPFPAVILFADVFGLRPTMREMAARLAASDGYAVLVPNPYYRTSRAPGLPTGLDFGSPADRDKVAKIRAPLTDEAVTSDTVTYVKYLDSQRIVSTKATMGVFGYCMGGPFTMQAAAANPERIGAGASFHGGGLVTDKPDSPHLKVPKMRAQFYFAIAMNDDQRQPDAKSKLNEAFKSVQLPAKIEVYDGCLHGWCVKDMPLQNGKPIYNEAQAERAWGELKALFKTAHV
jgi:carboxymethylenebutenolidase